MRQETGDLFLDSDKAGQWQLLVHTIIKCLSVPWLFTRSFTGLKMLQIRSSQLPTPARRFVHIAAKPRMKDIYSLHVQRYKN